jgi:hypothetical protein
VALQALSQTGLTNPASAGPLARTLGITEHMSSARVAFYFLGTVLLAVAAVGLGRQFAAGEDAIEWQGPCFLALFGLGALGVGLFSNVESTEDKECNDPRADGTGDLDGGTD